MDLVDKSASHLTDAQHAGTPPSKKKPHGEDQSISLQQKETEITERYYHQLNFRRYLAKFVLDVMHTARRTMSMPSYLGFVVSSIGVPKSSTPKAGVAWVTVCDKATLRASQSLRRSGTAKVLPMVSSRLSSWLSNTTMTTLVRFRIALLQIAIFAQDVAIFDEVPDLRKSLADALFDFFRVCTWENEKSELFKSFEKPLTVSAFFCLYIVSVPCTNKFANNFSGRLSLVLNHSFLVKSCRILLSD